MDDGSLVHSSLVHWLLQIANWKLPTALLYCWMANLLTANCQLKTVSLVNCLPFDYAQGLTANSPATRHPELVSGSSIKTYLQTAN